MKFPLKSSLLAGVLLAFLPCAAQGGWHGHGYGFGRGHSGFSFGFGIAPFGIYAPYCGPTYYGPAISGPPVTYYSPAPVYSTPVYTNAPVYDQPTVVYSAPAVVYSAPPVVYGPAIIVSPSFGYGGGRYHSYTHYDYHRR